MDNSMYDKLLELPLFQGLTKTQLTVILEKVKIEFRYYEPKTYIVKQNEPCTALIFLLDGRLRACATDTSHQFSLVEEICQQTLIEPYSLFGMQQNFHATYRAITKSSVLILKKKYIIPLLCKYEIFNLNYLNILSNGTQNLQQRLWNTHVGGTLDRMVNFLLMRCTYLQGPKELGITMEDFANLVGDTRINISRTLNELQDKGLLELKRKIIRIEDLNNLVKEMKLQEATLKKNKRKSTDIKEKQS